jgi:hypothetical protein
MSKLSSFALTMRRGVAVGMAVVAGAAIMPGSTSAAPDGGSPASVTSIPSGSTVSYDGDDDVFIGVTGRTLFNLGIAGSNYFGFNGDGIQLDLPITPLDTAGSGYGSPADLFIDLVGTDWLQ